MKSNKPLLNEPELKVNYEFSFSDLSAQYFHTKKDLLKTGASVLIGGGLGFAIGGLVFGIPFAVGGAFLSTFYGPSNSSQKDLFGKYYKDSPFIPLKKPSFFSKQNLLLSSLAIAGKMAHSYYSSDSDISFSDLYFNLDNYKQTLEDLTVGLGLGSVLNIFGDFFLDAFKNPKSFFSLIGSLFTKDNSSTLYNLAAQGSAEALNSLTSTYFKERDFDSALSLFFNQVNVKDNVPLPTNYGIDINVAAYLESNGQKRQLLTQALSQKFPKPFIDGLVDDLIKESFKKEDFSTLIFCAHYLTSTNSPDAKAVWEKAGKYLIDHSNNYTTSYLASGSAIVDKINFSKSKSSLHNSSSKKKSVSKQKHLADLSFVLKEIPSSMAVDQKILNNLAYDMYLDDPSFKCPLILHDGVVEGKNHFPIILLENSDTLFNYLEKHPSLVKPILDKFDEGVRKVKQVYHRAYNDGLVNFKEIDQSNRVFDQVAFFGKDNFNESVARDLDDRVNILTEKYDVIVPIVDALPEQVHTDNPLDYIAWLDFGNGGLRFSSEDYANQSFFIDKKLPDETIDSIIDFNTKKLSKNLDIDLNDAYALLYYQISRRVNHLSTKLPSRVNGIQRAKNLLNISYRAADLNIGLSSDYSFKQSQVEQINSIYSFLTKIS